MNWWVYGAVLLVAGLTAVLLVVDLARDRAAQDSHFVGLAATELVVLVQAVWAFAALARTDRDVEGVTLVSYLVTMILLPVVGAFFSLTERSRVGTSILLLAVVTIAAMEARVIDIWGAGV